MARALPDWPKALRRTTAAAYCDLPAIDFDKEVAAGRLPAPFLLGEVEHWSRTALDETLERLAGDRLPDWRAHSNFHKGRRNAA